MRCQMMTFTGKLVNPLAMRPEDVDIRDIAHGLALVNRFGGHSKFPLSVAQHAVYVSRVLHQLFTDKADADYMAWVGLHHDDSDTYIGDMPRLLKHSDRMAGFLRVESDLQEFLYGCFDIEPFMDGSVIEALRYADNLVLRHEIAQAMHPNFDRTVLEEQGLNPDLSAEEKRLIGGSWVEMDWKGAEQLYLLQAEILRPGSIARYSR